MPIYEYRCSSCGHELESLQKFADAPLTSCPACKGETLVKLVSAAGFHLKGSGWYATDFRGGSSPAKPAADAAAKPGAEAASGGDAKRRPPATARPRPRPAGAAAVAAAIDGAMRRMRAR